MDRLPDIDSYEQTLLAETREEITRADHKASILFGVFGLMAGSVIYAFVWNRWTPFELSNAVEWLWWGGFGLGLIAVGHLGWALYPVVDHPEDRSKVAYFGHVAKFETLGDFRRALSDRQQSETERLQDQIWVLSRAVDRKYRYTRWAMVLFASGVVAMGAAVLIDMLAS